MRKLFVLLLHIALLFACAPKPATVQANEEYLDVFDEEEVESMDITDVIEKPLESYNYVARETQFSYLTIPIELGIEELEAMINKQVDELLLETSSYEQDGLRIQADKFSDIQLKIEGQRITYLVPLKLQIEKDAPIVGTIKADGAIALQFFTDFDIAPDWTLETKSEIQAHQWIEKPKLRLGLINIPAKFIGDIVINQSRTIITKNIDEQIKQLETRKLMEQAWQQLHQPIELSKEHQIWLDIQPEELAVSPIKSTPEAVALSVSIRSLPEITIGTRSPVSDVPALPTFEFKQVEADDFKIFLNGDIGYDKAEQLAVENVKGETFESGKYKVTIEDIEIYGQDEKLVVGTKLSGSYKGTIYFTGEPYYNEFRNKVDVKNLDYTMSTKNFMLKTAGWLLKSNIRKQIRENVNFLIDDNLAQAKANLQSQFERYELGSGLVLMSNLGDVGVKDVYLSAEGIGVELGLAGHVNIRLEDLPVAAGKE